MTWVRVFSERIMHPTVFSYKVPGVGWGIGLNGTCEKTTCEIQAPTGAISQLCLHVNIGLNYQKNLSRWKTEVNIKSDWLRNEFSQSNQSGSKSKSIWLKT